MNLIGDWRYVWSPSSSWTIDSSHVLVYSYVDQAEIDTFGDVTTRYETITHGWLGQSIRTNYRITSRVPLHPAAGDINADFTSSLATASNLSHAALSFVHGGLAFGYPDLTPYPSRINTLGASLVGKLVDRTPLIEPYPPSTVKPVLPSTVTAEEIELNGVEGPYWARDWAEDETVEMCQKVEQVLDSIGCEKMLMGHTPLDVVSLSVFVEFRAMYLTRFIQVMSTRCDSKIVLVDTVSSSAPDSGSCSFINSQGISRGMFDSPSALEIVYTLTPTDARRTWKETQVGTAFYRGSSETLWSESQDVVGDFQQWH